MFQREEQDKTPGELSNVEINNLPKKSSVIVKKRFNELERKLNEHSQNFNKFKNLNKNQS